MKESILFIVIENFSWTVFLILEDFEIGSWIP